jgi:hypothetical protein
MPDITQYATVEEVKALMDDPWTHDLALSLALPAAQEAVDAWCRRTFTVTTATRVFSYTNPSLLRLPKELISLTSVISGQGEHTSVYLVGGPPYSVIYSGAGEPFTYSGSAGTITVTGVWGYKPQVPALVKLATIQWALYFYQELLQKGFQSITQNAVTATLFQNNKEPPAAIQNFLRGLRRVRIESISDQPFYYATTQF